MDAQDTRYSPITLEWFGTQGTLRIHGKTMIVKMQELSCGRKCVFPGHSGERLFLLQGNELRAILRKRLTCPRDAEECSTLPAGRIELKVITLEHTTILMALNETCSP